MLFSVLSITDAIRINFWIQYKILFNVDLRNTLHRLICILNVEIHPDTHDNQRCPENNPRHLAEYEERQQDSDKRRNCIVGTRPGRSDLALRENVKIYAEADRQKAQDHNGQRRRYAHRAFVNDEGNQQ